MHRHVRGFSIVGLLLACVGVGTLCATASAVDCGRKTVDEKLASQLLQDGVKAYESGDLQNAEARWQEVRSCQPRTKSWPKAVYNLGVLERKGGNPARAISYFQEVLASHPDDKEPGENLMETNRNYSHRSALQASQCYEDMADYWTALKYARLAKTKYKFYSWCGTCLDSEEHALNKRIALLTLRAAKTYIWAASIVGGLCVVGIVSLRVRRRKASRNG